MKLVPRIKLASRCPVCKTTGEHKEGCPMGELKRLQGLNLHIVCPRPQCEEGLVGINREGFYECRSCHTQWTAAALHDTLEGHERDLIDDSHAAALPISVFVLPVKGKGRFPLDAAIAKLRQELDRIKEAQRKRRLGSRKARGR